MQGIFTALQFCLCGGSYAYFRESIRSLASLITLWKVLIMNLSLYSFWGNISQNYISDFPFGGKKDNTVRVRNKSETMKRWLSFLTILFLFPGFNAFILIQISVLNSFKWLLTSEIVQLYSIFPQSSRWNWTGSFRQEKKIKKKQTKSKPKFSSNICL